jgi:hypothetical protein
MVAEGVEKQHMADKQRLSDFVGYLEKLPYAGLLVLKTASTSEIEDYLFQRGYRYSVSWNDLLANLAQHKSSYVLLYDSISKELYDSIVQFGVRRGAIQIFAKQTGQWKCSSCDPQQTHLLLVTRCEHFNRLNQRYNLCEKVGLIEYV